MPSEWLKVIGHDLYSKDTMVRYIAMDNLTELANVPASVLGQTDVPFYSDNQMLMQMSILME